MHNWHSVMNRYTHSSGKVGRENTEKGWPSLWRNSSNDNMVRFGPSRILLGGVNENFVI